MDYNTTMFNLNITAAEIALHEIGNMIMGLSFSMQKLSDKNPDLNNNEDYLDIKEEIKEMIQMIMNTKQKVNLVNKEKEDAKIKDEAIINNSKLAKKKIDLNKEIIKSIEQYDTVCQAKNIEINYITYVTHNNGYQNLIDKSNKLIDKSNKLIKKSNKLNDKSNKLNEKTNYKSDKLNDLHFFINGEKKDIRRVIDNFMKNAVEELSHEDNDILENKHIEITMVKNKDEIVIEFNNNGRVISSEKLKDIFNKVSTSKKNGMGIGLLICKDIIESFNGKIKAASDELSGTTFTIYLPIAN